MTAKLHLRHSFFALVLATTVFCPVWADGSPDLVGVLAAITDPAGASELGLSDDQLDKLRTLITQHESKALDFGSTLRNLPAQERRAKQLEALREIEKQGYAVLTPEQRVLAEKWRLQKVGPVAILETEIAEKLQVTEEQAAKAKNVLEGKVALTRSIGSEKAEAEIRKRLADVLTDEQKAKWTELAGQPVGGVSLSSGAAASSSDAAGAPSLRPGVESGKASANNGFMKIDGPIEGPEDGLLINFNAAPWQDVLKWIAREADLSLQVDYFPTGTFTYRDPNRRYTVAQAMDLMNSVLLSKGYTLVKKQRLLTCFDLAAGESAEVMRALLREMSELVTPAELDQRGEFEMVKTVFTIERSNIETIEREVKALIGPQGSIVSIPTASQLLITETGGKLRIIRDTIQRSETSDAKIVRLPLKYVSSEEVMAIGRSLLGIKDAEYRGEDISISPDVLGNTLFATGSTDKLQKLRDIVKELDIKPDESASSTTSAEQPVLKSHPLFGSDPTTTMDVLQTTFAGQPNINMALDPKTNKILARATKTDQELIEKIIGELAGQSSDFEVISLGNLDTNAAVLTLEKFYGKSTSSSSKDASTAKGPIFYGDPSARRLMVKGTKEEVDQIRMLLSKIEEGGTSNIAGDDGVRTLPLRGRAADRFLEQLELMNQARPSRIKISLPKGESASRNRESKSEKETPASKEEANDEKDSDAPPRAQVNLKDQGVLVASFLSPTSPLMQETSREDSPAEQPSKESAAEASVGTKNGEVRILRGPTGLIVASDDPKAMLEFDSMVRKIQDQMAMAPSEPTIRYLKHITANAAAEEIKNIIAGEQATGGGGGGLLGDVASNMLGGGGMFGALFGGGGSSSSGGSDPISGASTIGDVVITPDARLNAVWIQANPLDAMFVEDILEIIDVEESEIEIETRGKPRIIYLKNTPVEDVEPIVKQVFAQQIGQQQQGGAQPQQPSPQDILNLLRPGGGGGGRGGRGGGNAQSEIKEQTMSISSDKKNNSLIVVGPTHLFKRVESLVEQMDENAAGDEQVIHTIQLNGDVNPTTIQNALTNVFGSSAKTTSTGSSTPNATPNNSGRPAFDPSQFQRGGTNPFSFGQGGRGAGGGNFGGGNFGAGGANFQNRGQGGGGGNNQGGNRNNRGNTGNTRGTRN